MRDQREGSPRVGHCARLFFKPLEPFLVDDRADHNHPGRIARRSLEMLWTWVRRDLLPEEAKVLADEVSEALLAGDEPKAERLTRAFQDRAAAAIDASLDGERRDDGRLRRRMLAQIGTPRAAKTPRHCDACWRGATQLATLAAHLPLRIVNLADDQLDEYKAEIERASAPRRRAIPACAADGDEPAGGAVAGDPLRHQGGRQRHRGARCRDALRRRGEHRARRARAHGGRAAQRPAQRSRALRSARCSRPSTIPRAGLRTELDLPVDSTWGRALAAQRAQISELLRVRNRSRRPAACAGCCGRGRRPRSARNSSLDADEVAETEALIGFVGNCRYFAGELAINEMTQRTFTEIQQYLDSGTRALLDALRHAGDVDRSFRQSQVDAAVRFCAKVFGAGICRVGHQGRRGRRAPASASAA